VQILGMSSDDEMVATFLRGELSSERFGADIRACLASCGQPERPAQVAWIRVVLRVGEIARVRYMDYSYW
jgi:hypothetical protein